MLLIHLNGLCREDAEFVPDTFPLMREQDIKALERYLMTDIVLAHLNAVETDDLDTVLDV